jgi:hypothetical protein
MKEALSAGGVRRGFEGKITDMNGSFSQGFILEA